VGKFGLVKKVSFLTTWFNMWPFKKKTPETRSSARMERLTDFECQSIMRNYLCPDCNKGSLIKGPEGGMATNTCCEYCHSEFNLTFWGGTVFGERISEAGPRDAGDRGCLYGLPSKRLC
jgi:hypothetical protein